MKRILPLLLAALLLLAACGTPAPTDQTLPPERDPALPEDAAPTPHDGQDEDELPVLDGAEPPAGDDGEIDLPALSETEVTLNGVSSYLRVTLPEDWTWEQAGGTAEGTVYALYPEADPAFKVELHYWPEHFAMCGTGVTMQDYTLPDGQKATLAYEQIGEDFCWTLILPEAPDSFTIQFAVPYALYETHREALELMLGTIRQGVLAGLDVVTPDTAMG